MKNILLGITGSIAAYKSAELVRLFKKSNLNVKVVMTRHAKEFIHPNTFAALSGNRVYDDLFDPEIDPMMHIELAKWADAILIAPASASIIGKLASGIADDLLTTICLATRSRIVIAPAMNKEMWANAIVQDNVNKLQKKYSYEFLQPEVGEQACGDFGEGRLMEPEKIHDFFLKNKKGLLQGKRILITAGPTQEAIDPVRYISNRSSGKMGYALAKACAELGADVTLVSGPCVLESPRVNKFISINTAQEMLSAVLNHAESCDIFIGAAAVSDYSPKIVSENKIKKSNDEMHLALQKNPDILKSVSELKKRPFMVGFAAETENLIENAKSKLKEKNLDLIIANQVSNNFPFDSHENEITIISKNSEILNFPREQKIHLAKKIAQQIAKLSTENFGCS